MLQRPQYRPLLPPPPQPSKGARKEVFRARHCLRRHRSRLLRSRRARRARLRTALRSDPCHSTWFSAGRRQSSFSPTWPTRWSAPSGS